MDVTEAISGRRSIRKFEDKPVSEDMLRHVLDAATKAPSGKNRQPWHFVVLRGSKKAHLIELMEQGLELAKASGWNLGSGPNSTRIMDGVPVVILVFGAPSEPESRVPNVVDVQSVGAAIQNMLLSAFALGLGSLWICDVFYAKELIEASFCSDRELYAAVALGWAAESPAARPRKPVDEVTVWMD